MDQATQSASGAISTATNAGFAWLELTLNFQRDLQRAALESFSFSRPTSDTRISDRARHVNTGEIQRQANTAGIQVLPVGEERLNVAIQTVQGETTRIRRRVVSQPVEQQVTLRDEKVIVERRQPAASDAKGGVLIETIIEMSDSRQVPTVWKSQHVAGEVVLRKQVTERTETVRETVRRDVVEVEHDRGAVERRTENLRANPLPTSLVPVEQEHRAIGEAAQTEQEPFGKRRAEELRAAERRTSDEAAEKKPATLQPAGHKG
jgi:uncharacterized protein (TIGR02271 family)